MSPDKRERIQFSQDDQTKTNPGYSASTQSENRQGCADVRNRVKVRSEGDEDMGNEAGKQAKES